MMLSCGYQFLLHNYRLLSRWFTDLLQSKLSAARLCSTITFTWHQLWKSRARRLRQSSAIKTTAEPPVMSFSGAVSPVIALISADICSHRRPSWNRSRMWDMILTWRSPTSAVERCCGVCLCVCAQCEGLDSSDWAISFRFKLVSHFPAGKQAAHFTARREHLKAAVPVSHRILHLS